MANRIVLRRTDGVSMELIHGTSGHSTLVAVRVGDSRVKPIMPSRKYRVYMDYLRYYGKWVAIDKGVPHG